MKKLQKELEKDCADDDGEIVNPKKRSRKPNKFFDDSESEAGISQPADTVSTKVSLLIGVIS